MEVQGSIKVIGEVQEISATFKKREFIIDIAKFNLIFHNCLRINFLLRNKKHVKIA